MSHRDRSTNMRRAPQCAPPMSTARQHASRAPAIFPATAAKRFRETCFAGGRKGLPSSLRFIIVRDQPLEQPNAIARAPALIDVGFRRPHCRPRNVEMRPRRIVDEALQKLRRGYRAAVTVTGIFHVRELRID